MCQPPLAPGFVQLSGLGASGFLPHEARLGQAGQALCSQHRPPLSSGPVSATLKGAQSPLSFRRQITSGLFPVLPQEAQPVRELEFLRRAEPGRSTGLDVWAVEQPGQTLALPWRAV